MREDINIYEYMGSIVGGVKKGVLLTTKKDGKVNTMTISWGTIGIEWHKPIFTTFVRTGRHTHTMLESGEFTINIPMGDCAKILSYCGSNSGRDTDKITDMGLTTVDGVKVSAPGIKELPLTLECKVVYSQLQDSGRIPQDIKDKTYTADTDFHTAFYGEIVAAYIIK